MNAVKYHGKMIDWYACVTGIAAAITGPALDHTCADVYMIYMSVAVSMTLTRLT